VSSLAACSIACLALSTSANPALGSPALGALSRTAEVNLRIDPSAATRVLAADEGASQEPDSEKPKAMDDQASAAAAKAAGPKKPGAPEAPEDKFAFAKDWPFWVIVGGVVVAGAATFMLVRNANDTPPCGARYTAGCFGAR
jgi:uncharacterized membrane protein